MQNVWNSESQLDIFTDGVMGGGRGCYRVCHGFRLRKQIDYFWVTFDHLTGSDVFWDSRENWLEPKTDSQQLGLTKLSFVQIPDTLCRSTDVLKRIFIAPQVKSPERP